MRKRGVETILPRDGDYGVTWESVRSSFKKQYVPESAISVIRKEWHALRGWKTMGCEVVDLSRV